ncbi:hypothetical protein BJ170DRAFT_595675 [Xylariales sp. AK1849]|nr:hypothetical protein BJ170DRAFT_595675 [Xylariales sp. AK1849]
MLSPLPVYVVPKGKKRSPPKVTASRSAAERSRPSTASSAAPVPTRLFQSFSDMLEPAVDGPPSPERIRALSKQMKRESIADNHHSQQTRSSSGSSSQLSTTSDRPSWEYGLESLTLSRKSSQRSTANNMSSRERPESVQIFGKTLFNRRGKVRRESSGQDSSNSSSHSAELPLDATSNASKDQHFLNSMLARRRTGGVGNEQSNRKLQISGPYNFQHLAHTEKDTVSESSRLRYARRPTDASSMGLQADQSPFTNRSSEALPVQQDPSAGLHVSNDIEPHTRPYLDRAQTWQTEIIPPPVPMRSVKRVQSQEQIRVPPPRPPRSPVGHGFTSPFPPPLRVSSRASARHAGFDHLCTLYSERPITGSGFRHPKPLVLPSPTEAPVPSALSNLNAGEQHVAAESHEVSHAITTPDDAAWPLSANAVVAALPDVPEEEESYIVSRQSRISIASNRSSLRGSVSVPLLRQMSQSQAITVPRPPSNASDTLGRLDLLAAQRALQANSDDESVCDEFPRETWEDDIDYCYEHEAEADCDYAWERLSCDLVRDEEEDTQTVGQSGCSHDSGSLHRLLAPSGRYDVPALSPTSQLSNTTPIEAKTPTVPALPVTSNFSLPRRDSSAILLRGHDRNMSYADSFKESQGFDLSPTLLIPNDYHQQMLLHERGELREQDEDAYLVPSSPGGMNFAKSVATRQARASASTTASATSERSATSSRHKSNTSTSTTLTRWTSNSATIEGWQAPVEEKDQSARNFEKSIISPLPEVDEGHVKRDTSRERHARAHSHADVHLVKSKSETTVATHKPVKETIKTRRRAKTTSKSHNTAPVTLGLFPSTMGRL